MFQQNKARFATGGVIAHLPGPIIDSLWFIIDHDLQGTFQLANLLVFALEERQGQLTVAFSQDGENIAIRIDLPFPYDEGFPPVVYAYDDGNRQTILLPSEANPQE